MANLDIEIVEVNVIEGGVEIFARAWSDGVQIGFGTDGTVDIERFRIINPPVLVADPNGSIVIPGSYDELTDTTYPDSTFREDPEEATLQALEDIIRVKTEKFGADNIVPGKRGNTTTTVYSTAGDGAITSNSANWTTCRNGNSLSVAYTETTRNVYFDNAYNLRRLYFPFDTSAVGGDTVSAATFSAYADVSVSQDTANKNLGIIAQTQASATVLASGDWAPDSFSRLCDTDVDITTMRAGSDGYFDWAFNATGIAHVDGSGRTDIIMTHDVDIDNVTPISGSFMTFYMSEDGGAGTTRDPKLVVEHAAGGGSPTYNALAFASF